NYAAVQNLLEAESGASAKVLANVKGRLRKHIEFWKKIGTSNFILSVISDGYRLPFIQAPPCRDISNNKSAFAHSNFVNEAINELLLSGRVLQVSQLPHVINPLSVSVQRSGKKRLILDLRHVNQYLEKQAIKYEDWKVGLSYFQKGAFMISFDLKSGYHHIEIHPEYQTFLGFAWKFPDSKTRRSDLADSGLITNEQKYKRITSMLEGLNLVFQRKFLVSARELASLVGKIISADEYCQRDSTGCGAHFDFNGEKIAKQLAKLFPLGICADNAIHLEIQWIPRTEIAKADFISRLIDIDDWQITRDCFEAIDRLWGIHTVDCFANYYNKKTSLFFGDILAENKALALKQLHYILKVDIVKYLQILPNGRSYQSVSDQSLQRYYISYFNLKHSRHLNDISKRSASLSVGVISLAVAYMSKVYNQSQSYSSLVLIHSALKWYHSFLPLVHQNPFDNMIKAIVDKYATSAASLNDLRLTCLCTLGFAAFLRFDELSNIVPLHLTITSGDIGTIHDEWGLRSGGATAAVRHNRNLSERSLKIHGRWRTRL
ncbi:Hypothetical predicted protein, partial [Paramuricea clavata]